MLCLLSILRVPAVLRAVLGAVLVVLLHRRICVPRYSCGVF